MADIVAIGRDAAARFELLYPEEYAEINKRAIRLTALHDDKKNDAERVFQLRVANGLHYGELLLQRGIDVWEEHKNPSSAFLEAAFLEHIGSDQNGTPHYDIIYPRYRACPWCRQRNKIGNLYCAHCGGGFVT